MVNEIAGIIAVPKELIEAAKIDGANTVSYTHLDVYKRQPFWLRALPRSAEMPDAVLRTLKFRYFKHITKRHKAQINSFFRGVQTCPNLSLIHI